MLDQHVGKKKNLMWATGSLTPEVNEILPTQAFIPRSSSLSEHEWTTQETGAVIILMDPACLQTALIFLCSIPFATWDMLASFFFS